MLVGLRDLPGSGGPGFQLERSDKEREHRNATELSENDSNSSTQGSSVWGKRKSASQGPRAFDERAIAAAVEVQYKELDHLG